jgi:hypothetical protein
VKTAKQRKKENSRKRTSDILNDPANFQWLAHSADSPFCGFSYGFPYGFSYGFF